METVSDFIFGGSKTTAGGDCSQEIKRQLLIWRKVMNNLDSILKSRDITLQQRSIWSKLWFFQWTCMDVRVGLWRKLSAEKLMLLNYGVGETLENPLDCKESQSVHPKGDQSWVLISCSFHSWKDWCWSWNSNTLDTWCEELTHLKRPWSWERLRAGEGDNRGWWLDGITNSMNESR